MKHCPLMSFMFALTCYVMSTKCDVDGHIKCNITYIIGFMLTTLCLDKHI